MEEDNNTYNITCVICETELEVTVIDNEEEPCYCPMCGSATLPED